MNVSRFATDCKISFINFSINPKSVKKSTKILKLKPIFNLYKNQEFPIMKGNLTIDTIKMCNSSQGCDPKTSKGVTIDRLVAYKNEKSAFIKNEDHSKYILMWAQGKYKLGNTFHSISFRIPKSADINTNIGLFEQKVFLLDSSADENIETLLKNIEKDFLALFPIIQNTILSKQTNIKNPKLTNMSLSGYNLFGIRPQHKIKNFKPFFMRLFQEIIKHTTDYTLTSNVVKEIKSVEKATFKSKGKVTFNFTAWGLLDFQGAKSISSVISILPHIQNSFNQILGSIKYNMNSSYTAKPNRLVGGCPSGNPLAINGNCENDMIPIPNEKTGKVCCYKKKLTPKLATQIIQKFVDRNMEIPQIYKKYLSKSSLKTFTKSNTLPKYNSNSKTFFYKGINILKNCDKVAKTDLISLSKEMALNPKGKKEELCSAIVWKLLSNHKKSLKLKRNVFNELKKVKV
tara:strand:- start:964 stop:2337 length:1374 start_codon:yes stop_codon:yes gene_type:complete